MPESMKEKRGVLSGPGLYHLQMGLITGIETDFVLDPGWENPNRTGCYDVRIVIDGLTVTDPIVGKTRSQWYITGHIVAVGKKELKQPVSFTGTYKHSSSDRGFLKFDKSNIEELEKGIGNP